MTPINFGLFLTSFARDRDYHDTYRQDHFLDLHTGEILVVYANNEEAAIDAGAVVAAENSRSLARIGKEPTRFVKIPGLSHGKHHELLQEFLESNWTSDQELKQQAVSAYHKSIGAWLAAMESQGQAVQAWEKFKSRRTEQMAHDFIRSLGTECFET